jgi:hypothetical protein
MYHDSSKLDLVPESEAYTERYALCTEFIYNIKHGENCVHIRKLLACWQLIKLNLVAHECSNRQKCCITAQDAEEDDPLNLEPHIHSREVNSVPGHWLWKQVHNLRHCNNQIHIEDQADKTDRLLDSVVREAR